mgnify:CR=1 FL=1
MNGIERLEEIKSRVWKDKGTYEMGDYSQREGYIYTLSDYDYEWLIEQAERLEAIIKHRNDILKANEYLNEQNKRYREALEFYANEENYFFDEKEYKVGLGVPESEITLDYGNKAREALEEGTDD